MSVFDKIAAQQRGKEHTAVWMVGEQLKDIIRDDPRLQELVDKDLDNQGMTLAECEKQIKVFSDKNKPKGANAFCVSPIEAERIIREFYGLGEVSEGKPAPKPSGSVLSLADFL